MVQKITSYKSSTGRSFETEFEAWKDELADFLDKHGADNDAIARKIVGVICDKRPASIEQLMLIAKALERTAPEPEVVPPMPMGVVA